MTNLCENSVRYLSPMNTRQERALPPWYVCLKTITIQKSPLYMKTRCAPNVLEFDLCAETTSLALSLPYNNLLGHLKVLACTICWGKLLHTPTLQLHAVIAFCTSFTFIPMLCWWVIKVVIPSEPLATARRGV